MMREKMKRSPMDFAINDPWVAYDGSVGFDLRPIKCPVCHAIIHDHPDWKREHIEWHMSLAKDGGPRE
jgi:hypothetical protein